jgi:membrane-bound lytic murein transglycosylase D
VFQAPAAEDADAPSATAKKPRHETAATRPEAAKATLAVARPSRLAGLNAAAPQVHRVQQGDTLFNISQRFNVSVQVLREFNHLKTDEVKLGQKLLVPQG